MKRKTIYLILLICGASLISFARQRCTDNCEKEAAANANSEGDTAVAKKGYDLSPVGFFVLNM